MKKLFLVLLTLFSTLAFADRAPYQLVERLDKLTVVTEVFPPFQFKRNGQLVGPMLRIMQETCAIAKLECDIIMQSWQDSIKAAEDGKADVIFSILLDAKERKDQFILSPPIVATSYAFFTSSSSNWTWTGNPKELNGRTVGAYGPSGTSIVALEVLSINPSATLEIETTNLVAFQNLVIGRYGEKSAMVANKDVGLALLKYNNIYGPKPAGDIKQAVYGFGFSKKSLNLQLAPRFFDALTQLIQRGRVAKILRENADPLVPAS